MRRKKNSIEGETHFINLQTIDTYHSLFKLEVNEKLLYIQIWLMGKRKILRKKINDTKLKSDENKN